MTATCRSPARADTTTPPGQGTCARPTLGLVVSLLLTWPLAAKAQEWVPFPEPDTGRTTHSRTARPLDADARPLLPPMDGRIGRDERQVRGMGHDVAPNGGGNPSHGATRLERDALVREPLPPLDERSRSVERGELQPAVASDGSGLPHELWRGLDTAKVEALFAVLEIPPRSPALANLWRRLVTAESEPSHGGGVAREFAALRIEALDRSGLVKEAGEAIARLPGGQGVGSDADALAAILTARNEIALGRRETACEAIKAAPPSAPVPRRLKGEALLISGYCAIAAGNAAAAGLTADLAREHGIEHGAGLAALDAMTVGGKPDVSLARRISPLDYRLLGLAGGAPAALVAEKATPALLSAIAIDPAADPHLRLLAGEAAARLNAISAADLAAIYRALPAEATTADVSDGARRRAELYKAAEMERTPLKKVRRIRAFLDDARRAGLYLPALEMMSDPSGSIALAAEIGWFAETAIEIALAAGHYERAREWVSFAATMERGGAGDSTGTAGPMGHWAALADIADPGLAAPRGTSLASIEQLALSGRFAPDLLNRLATVLDALDTNVPIPLWEAASRTPQPAGGHLPETGVLSELLDASKKKEFGRTVLIAMQALGPSGAEGAHMIALGDAIRALKRAGLATEARRLGFEALFASWPRTAAL